MSKVFGPAATLIGCIIGAGILGIPYVVSKVGLLAGIIEIILIGIAILFLNIYLGEIAVKTKDRRQLVRYAEKYLGKNGKGLMWVSMVLVIYGALVAYTIKEGEFINALASPFFGGSPLIYSTIFLFLMAVLVYFNLNFIEKTESLIVVILMSIILFISVLAMPHINKANFTQFNPQQIFVPYGVVLFSFLGFVAIPEMKEQIKKNKEMLKKAIIIGSIVPIAIYILFAFVVVGVTGNNTSDGAILGLGEILGYEMLVFGTLFGIMTMMSSFIILAFSLKKMYEYDCSINKNLSWFLTCTIPLIIILLGAKSFVKTIGFSGSLAGGLMGILIALMYMKSRKQKKVTKEKIICGILILLFCLGILYEILSVLRLISI